MTIKYININNVKYQNSDRDARPEKSVHLVKHVFTDSMNHGLLILQ